MIVYWRKWNLDWFLTWEVNRIMCLTLQDRVIEDAVLTPSPIYLWVKKQAGA